MSKRVDTLFLRIFVLVWVVLVVSHFAAFGIVTQRWWPGIDAAGDWPTMPSLPPTPGLLEPRDGPPPDAPREPGRGGDRGPPGPRPGGPPALPTHLLVLDYAVRLLVIAAAAWLAARWLAAPMQRLATASRALVPALHGDAAPPRLDEGHGPAEVRDAAQVFNQMAAELHAQFKARGLLMASISHDLRTPLTRLRLRLEALPDDAPARRGIDDIHEMDALIDGALQVFRSVDSDEPAQRIDVFALVQALVDDLAELGQAVSVGGEAAVVAAQPLALQRIVSNLIGNALRYGQRAEVGVMRADGVVRVLVDDQGPGIPEDQLEAVFQPFRRLDPARQRGGAGLGLYIARDLAQRQGGSLTLANRAQGGLRAQLQLPRA